MATGTKKLLIGLPIAIIIGVVMMYNFFPGTTTALLVKAGRSASGLAKHHIQADGLQFAYLEGGAGDVLVLLHGFGASKDNWVGVSKHLTSHFRVIAPDLIGFGESDLAPDNDYTIVAQVLRVRQFVRALGIEDMHLGGSSMGGYIAGIYASLYPAEIQSLLLVAPGGVAAAKPSEMSQRLDKGQSVPLLVADRADYEGMLDFIFYDPPFIPGPVKRTLAKEAIARRSHYLAIWNQLLGSWGAQPLEDQVRGLTMPTLVIWGAQDRVLHVSGAEIIAAAMPNARKTVLDAAGHLLIVEKPDEIARVYLNFLGRGAKR